MQKKRFDIIIKQIWEYQKRNDFTSIWENMPIAQCLYSEEILKKLKESQDSKDSKLLEELLIICTLDGYDLSYTPIFCDLLKQNWHDRHEDIVMGFEEMKDPNSIDCIYNAALKIPAWDDGRSLAKKSIWALKAIGTSKAIRKIELLADSQDEIIKEVAKMNLNS